MLLSAATQCRDHSGGQASERDPAAYTDSLLGSVKDSTSASITVAGLDSEEAACDSQPTPGSGTVCASLMRLKVISFLKTMYFTPYSLPI